MGVYSVEKYVRNMLDGLAWTGLTDVPNLQAYMTPPAVDPADSPKAYILAGRAHRDRQTAPRGAGFNKRPWAIDVYLTYLDSPDDQLANETFDQIIDQVIAVFETQTMPVLIDPSGNVVNAASGSASDTQIQAVGEVWDLQKPPDRMPATLRMIYNLALLSVTVVEVKQG